MNRQAVIPTLLAVLCAFVAPLSAFSQPALEVIPVAGNIYRFSGSMTNCVLLKNAEGAVVVDSSETPELAQGMLAAMENIKGGPLEYLVNTHWHYDHANGNLEFAQAGATIIAQSAVRSKLETTPTQDGKPLTPERALPEICVKQDLTLFFGDEAVYIYHPETDGAHTMGDSVVYFKTSNVIAMGDLLFTGMYPYIDPQDNGWPQGMVAALNEVANMIDDKTVVIPGHGPVTDKKGLLAFADMLQDVGQKIDAMMKAGRTLDEIKQAKPTADWDEPYGKVWMNGDTFTELIWNCLRKHE
jgi:cyclase